MPVPSPFARDRFPWLVVGGILLTALSLRGPIVAPAPVIGEISRDLGLTTTAAGLVTSLPVLCFALTTPLATWLARRAGAEVAVLVSLLGVLAGTLVRSAGPTSALIAGTVLIGTAITVGNIVLPVVIRRDVPPSRAGAVTGAYTAALNIGSMLTSIGTAPLAAVVGWRGALLSWGVVTGVGLVLWVAVVQRRPSREARLAAAGGTEPLSRGASRTGWLLTVAFCGQAFAYYAVTAWLPTLLTEERGLAPTASGAIASLFQVAAVVGALGVPVLAARAPAWAPPVAVAVLWCVLPIGLLLAPGAYVVWSLVGGVAQGGGFTAVFSVVVRIARSDRTATQLSARVQTWGYLTASAGPVVAGALHAATGTWTAPLLAVLAATVTFGVVGALAALGGGRER